MSGQPTVGTDSEGLHKVTCEPHPPGQLYLPHKLWASGEIADREYRILRSVSDTRILIKFEDMDEPVVYRLQDLLCHAHEKTRDALAGTPQEDDDGE